MLQGELKSYKQTGKTEINFGEKVRNVNLQGAVDENRQLH